MQKFIDLNYKWWCNNTIKKKDLDVLDSDDELTEHFPHEWITISKECIKRDNPTYDMLLLAKINKWAITIDSQENLNINVLDKPIKIHHYYSKFLNDAWGYSYKDLKDNLIISNYQRAYLEVVTSIKNANKLWEGLKDSTDFGLIKTTKKETVSNDLFKYLEDDTFSRFKLNNRIALTFQKTKNSVQNHYLKSNLNWINSTNFPVNYEHYKEEEVLNKNDDFCCLFIVARNCSIEINNLFQLLVNIFEK